MSRIFEALKKSTTESGAVAVPTPDLTDSLLSPQIEAGSTPSIELDGCAPFKILSAAQSRLISLTDERSIGAEKLRVLATRLRHLRNKKDFSTVLITSSTKGEGKSLITANLALTFSKQVRHQTLVIDCDFRCPTLHRMFGVDASPGIGDWWMEDLPLNRVIRKHPELPLWFMAAGHVPDQPLEILQSQRFAELITKVGGLFRWVVIDSPPLTPMADSSVLGHLAEGIVLVVREGVTSARALSSAMDSLDRKKLLGVVVNQSTKAERRYYDQYYK
jgi:capsular exopolysaccharide synthesis family protein